MSHDASSPARNRQSFVRFNILFRGTLLTLLVSLFFRPAASGQATVNESLETAYVYVDAVKGSDTNSGTQSSPLKTIGAAATLAQTNNQNSIGTRVTINPGTYRESVKLSHDKKDTSLPITFQAATNGTVIVSGATIYTGWQKYDANPGIYTDSWTNDWGICPQLTTCPFQQDIMMRQEMVIVNGVALTQVLSMAQMVPGAFYVDQTGGHIYIWPSTSTNMSTATVEVASLPTLFTIQNKSNIVVRGLTFQYANTCRASAAFVVQGSSTNILIDNDTFQWNNGQGLALQSPTTYFTVQNTVSQHNGDSGFQESQTNHGSWQSDTTSYNNWRGAQAGYYACNTAGLHGWEAHNDTINSLTTDFNQTYGIHWDTDNANISTTGIKATSNLLNGLYAEKDEGPISFSGAYVCNQTSALGVGGLVLRNSENITLTNSVLINNTPSQIMIIGLAGGIQVTNWETGVTTNLVTQNFTNTSNIIQGSDSSQLVFKDSYLKDADWTSFQSTLKSSNNTWWNALNTTTPFTVPTPKSGSKEDFAGWQSATAVDSSSSFKAPSGDPGAACNLTPVGTDFWLTVDQAAATMNTGATATYNLTVTPLNFTRALKLTVDGVSEVKGLSATLSPSWVKGSGTAVLTVTAGTNTAAGDLLDHCDRQQRQKPGQDCDGSTDRQLTRLGPAPSLAYIFEIVVPPLMGIQTLAPSNAASPGWPDKLNVPRFLPSLARNLVTVALSKFATQIFAPSKTRPSGPVPAVNVPSSLLSLARSFVTVPLVVFDTHIFEPSNATPCGFVPTAKSPIIVPSLTRTLATTLV